MNSVEIFSLGVHALTLGATISFAIYGIRTQRGDARRHHMHLGLGICALGIIGGFLLSMSDTTSEYVVPQTVLTLSGLAVAYVNWLSLRRNRR